MQRLYAGRYRRGRPMFRKGTAPPKRRPFVGTKTAAVGGGTVQRRRGGIY